ncbi:MAG: hypothetical protein E5Y31_07885 [Mesorhizobium sp.]|nr:MAG: hypothetical protein E5Y31_07885 [Mesorhizobium sp.]
MNDFMTPAGDKPFWVAHIKPSSYPNPISFSQHAAPTFTEKVENVRRAAEALKRAMTDLHGVPCKISVADSSDCFIVMTVKAVRS